MDTEQQQRTESSLLIGEVGEIGIERIEDLEGKAYRVIDSLRNKVFSPSQEKVLNKRYTISQAAEMVGRSTTTIRESEVAGGRLPVPAKNEKGRRVGYSLEEINNMRRVFGTQPYRDNETDDAIIIAIQSFKGGVGKSTLTAHLAQSFAEDGYRVCVIDTDPQASTTSLFGLNPALDLECSDTLHPYLSRKEESIRYAVRNTYWDQLKLVPSTLDLYDIEYELAGQLPSNPLLLDTLRTGVTVLAQDFDIVLIDSPPALGMISLSVLRTANALIVPVRPATIDFGSTAHFFTMLKESLQQLKGLGMNPSYKFFKVLVNDMDENKSAHVEIKNMMETVFGTEMLKTVMKNSAEIDNAGARLMTVYELEKPITSKKTHKRCRASLDALNKELRTLIRRTWPSQREALRQEGAV